MTSNRTEAEVLLYAAEVIRCRAHRYDQESDDLRRGFALSAELLERMAEHPSRNENEPTQA